MGRHGLWTFFLLFLISACGSNTEPQETAIQSPPPDNTNLTIAKRVYDDDRTPDGFYQDPQLDGSAFFSVVHIRANQVAMSSLGFELCSDDFAQALQWSETYNTDQNQTGPLVETQEGELFFQFARSLDTVTRLERIFKCGYLDRTGVDTSNSTFAGTLNQSPIQLDHLKLVAEYLWTFSPYNNVGSIVIDSVTQQDGTSLTHTLRLARRLPAAGAQGCDYIELIEWGHTLDLNSSVLDSTEIQTGGFSARRDNASIELCD